MYRENKSSGQTLLDKRLKRDWVNSLNWKSWQKRGLFVPPVHQRQAWESRFSILLTNFPCYQNISKSHSQTHKIWQNMTHLCRILLIKSLTTDSLPGLSNYSWPQLGPQPDVQGGTQFSFVLILLPNLRRRTIYFVANIFLYTFQYKYINFPLSYLIAVLTPRQLVLTSAIAPLAILHSL